MEVAAGKRSELTREGDLGAVAESDRGSLCSRIEDLAVERVGDSIRAVAKQVDRVLALDKVSNEIATARETVDEAEDIAAHDTGGNGCVARSGEERVVADAERAVERLVAGCGVEDMAGVAHADKGVAIARCNEGGGAKSGVNVVVADRTSLEPATVAENRDTTQRTIDGASRVAAEEQQVA